ncbi:sigma-54-dependent Fis family transcriptional regulator [Halorhodospira abdelmalekii]|uniref:sigma-54-dependent transcriptional regulator n=1 Tax=Halorhodospira abdelmalekii TaxID=421629 RepID=UPI0019039508|nr:sigma-54 dependent transcriptional regulator [Halorhodospira abdelmalekii]MBK1735557.1 sigma-54-dependent Fis family transcriptional regulator [Halorhodospira abdelmalekii]
MKGCILVIDDHREVVYAVRRLLESHGLETLSAATPQQAYELLDQADALIVDIRLEHANGLELLQQLRSDGCTTPAIILSAHTFPDNVIEASKHGAIQVLAKPIDAEALINAAREALRQAARPQSPPTTINHEAHSVLGTSSAMMEVFKGLGIAANNTLNVLLTGETGVGKEVSAELIHRHSARAQQPFIAINCTAIPENLFETELFGHTSGAFTGATHASSGKIEAARGGTLFLDEIGDMPASFQAKLLRFLEDKCFYRLGETTPRQADVRIIAATNRDLLGQPEERSREVFRSDLYFRLAQIPIEIPPLRQRLEDLPSLIDLFIRQANQELGLELEGISDQALTQAYGHPWAGNVRELKNTIYRTAARQQRGVIEQLELISGGAPSGDRHSSSAPSADQAIDQLIDHALEQGRLSALLQQLEQRALTRALSFYSGNKSRVADALGISRNTLRAKLRTIEPDHSADPVDTDGPINNASPVTPVTPINPVSSASSTDPVNPIDPHTNGSER